jgi:hypothetical protein
MIKQRIANWLNIQPVVVEKEITLKDTLKKVEIGDDVMEGLTSTDENVLLREAHTFAGTLLFKVLGKTLINKQAMETIQQAETERQFDYGRAVMNATMMYEDEILKLSTKYEELNRQDEVVVEPYEVI